MDKLQEEMTVRHNFGAKPILYPMPVLIIGTYNADGTPNAMNAAWGGISEENEISICIDDGHKTAENLARGGFTVSVGDEKNLVACDYVGIVSGNKVPDKIARTGWTVTKSDLVDAPIFNELPLTLECSVISYDKDTCTLKGRIANVSADESICTDGKIDLNKFTPITYDPVNHSYRKLGNAVGKAFSDGMRLK